MSDCFITADDARTKGKILVVEDEEVVSQICQAVLEKEGFAVHIAANGQEAKEMINMNHYDLFLIDILTPKMSGRQLYQWLLGTHPQLADKVVFCTGMTMEGNVKKFLRENGRPLLLKPFSPDELVNTIQETWH
jgi:CheY-like chemotaxis protein